MRCALARLDPTIHDTSTTTKPRAHKIEIGAHSAAVVLASPPVAWADGAPASGRVIFETKCVGCHEGGGNVLSPGKTLQLAALERNGYSTVEPVIELIRNGKGQVRAAVLAAARMTIH